MSDVPWMDKPTFMAHVGKSERTVQIWVTAGKAERQIIDGKAYYRLTPQHPVAVQHPDDAPPWAVELLEEIRALRGELAAAKTLQPPVAYTAANAAAPVATTERAVSLKNPQVPGSNPGGGQAAETPPPAEGRSTATPRSAGFWARLFGRGK